jgi:mono/diheme cytochrome c family protein
MKKLIYILVPLYFFVVSCEHDPVYETIVNEDPGDGGNGNGGNGNGGNGCDPNLTYFANDVRPIIASNCAVTGCHGGGSAQDGVDLSSYEGIMAIVDVDDPMDSELIEVITEDDPDKIMPPPPNNQLTDEQIATLLAWINQGALNNECTTTDCDLTNVTYSGTVWPILQNNCTGCHSGGSPSGGISLTNYNEISQVASNGLLSAVINHESGVVAMPLNTDQLSQCDIDRIDTWIDAGYPND